VVLINFYVNWNWLLLSQKVNWNVNFLQNSGKLQKLQNLLLMYNLENTVKSPRITSHSKSLIDVIILNSTSEAMFTEVLDLGYSDHLAQIVHLRSKEELRGPLTICDSLRIMVSKSLSICYRVKYGKKYLRLRRPVLLLIFS
jgi:hypothetical protein